MVLSVTSAKAEFGNERLAPSTDGVFAGAKDIRQTARKAAILEIVRDCIDRQKAANPGINYLAVSEWKNQDPSGWFDNDLKSIATMRRHLLTELGSYGNFGRAFVALGNFSDPQTRCIPKFKFDRSEGSSDRVLHVRFEGFTKENPPSCRGILIDPRELKDPFLKKLGLLPPEEQWNRMNALEKLQYKASPIAIDGVKQVLDQMTQVNARSNRLWVVRDFRRGAIRQAGTTAIPDEAIGKVVRFRQETKAWEGARLNDDIQARPWSAGVYASAFEILRGPRKVAAGYRVEMEDVAILIGRIRAAVSTADPAFRRGVASEIQAQAAEQVKKVVDASVACLEKATSPEKYHARKLLLRAQGWLSQGMTNANGSQILTSISAAMTKLEARLEKSVKGKAACTTHDHLALVGAANPEWDSLRQYCTQMWRKCRTFMAGKDLFNPDKVLEPKDLNAELAKLRRDLEDPEINPERSWALKREMKLYPFNLYRNALIGTFQQVRRVCDSFEDVTLTGGQRYAAMQNVWSRFLLVPLLYTVDRQEHESVASLEHCDAENFEALRKELKRCGEIRGFENLSVLLPARANPENPVHLFAKRFDVLMNKFGYFVNDSISPIRDQPERRRVHMSEDPNSAWRTSNGRRIKAIFEEADVRGLARQLLS